MVMFVMFSVIFASAGVIMDERKDNTWNRLIMSPTQRSTIMAGNIIGTFVKGCIQVMFIVLFSKFAIGVDWGQSLSALTVIMSMFIVAVTGLGLFLATIIKTNAQLNAISSIVITCTTMVSGCYWPLELEPQFMQDIAVLFPQYWAMKGMRNVIENNMGLQSVVTPVLALAVMGIIFFAASVLLSGGLRLKIKKTPLSV
jgi:ABC-2 type transport system permease protein